MINISEYLERKGNGDSYLEQMIGKYTMEELAVLHKNYEKVVKAAETSILVEACESCYYSSEELKIFRTGVRALSALMQEAAEEMELKAQKAADRKERKKNKKPVY